MIKTTAQQVININMNIKNVIDFKEFINQYVVRIHSQAAQNRTNGSH